MRIVANRIYTLSPYIMEYVIVYDKEPVIVHLYWESSTKHYEDKNN